MFNQKSILYFEQCKSLPFIIQITFKGQNMIVKDMVISSKFLPPFLLNRKFIVSMKGKGKFRVKDPLIQLYHYKLTGAVID
jgi:hypothetical protein